MPFSVVVPPPSITRLFNDFDVNPGMGAGSDPTVLPKWTPPVPSLTISEKESSSEVTASLNVTREFVVASVVFAAKATVPV